MTSFTVVGCLLIYVRNIFNLFVCTASGITSAICWAINPYTVFDNYVFGCIANILYLECSSLFLYLKMSKNL